VVAVAGQSGELLEQQQGKVLGRALAGEHDVAELVLGVDGERAFRPQLEVEPETVTEPLSLTVAVTSPPVDLGLIEVVD